MTDDRRTRWLGWLQLLRVPNLPTVPGDPLVGAVLAATAAGQAVPARQAIGVALAALFLYMAGLALNDLHDLPDDRLHRPERPLPRGVVSVRAAWRAFALLAALGLAAAATGGWPSALAGLGLLALICLYNLRAKACPASACLVMGLCRGASLMLGAVALGRPAAAALPALALTLYIGAVTWLSRREDETQRPGLFVLLPPLAILGGCGTAWLGLGAPGHQMLWLALACATLATAQALRLSLTLFRRDIGPGPARAAVGRFIRLLLPWQAALLLLGSTPALAVVALALLAAWPLARGLSRRFNAS
jgi:4-hydroxybenzoate polyprenyltransferase